MMKKEQETSQFKRKNPSRETGTKVQLNQILIITSLLLNYIALYYAKKDDLTSIEKAPLKSYTILITTIFLLQIAYFQNPMSIVINMLSTGVLAIAVSIIHIILGIQFIGAYDLIYIYLESASLYPIIIENYYIPTILIHFIATASIAIYQLKVKEKLFVRMFEIHEATGKYILLGEAITYILYWFLNP